MKCVINNDGKFYLKTYLEEARFVIEVWSPTKLWDWCLSEDEKKGIEPIFNVKN